jgi:hypothetical protein
MPSAEHGINLSSLHLARTHDSYKQIILAISLLLGGLNYHDLTG